jgi:NADH-quinone oxidoreductase subunit N
VNEYLRYLPEATLGIGGTIVLLVGAVRDEKNVRDFLRWLSLVVLALCGGALAFLSAHSELGLDATGWTRWSPITFAFSVAFLAISGWTLFAAAVPEKDAGEWYSLLIFATLGMMVLARSNNLPAIFLGIEILALSLYILIAFRYEVAGSIRGAAMYLILAGFASAFIAFGLALVYASFGTLKIDEIEKSLWAVTTLPPLAYIGFGLFLSGVAFKLALVPFHMWAPDVYESAPSPVSGIIASASKGAVLAALISLSFLVRPYEEIFYLLALTSMIGGNLLGLMERRVKRILAYSSIGHVGYVVMAYLGASRPPVTGSSWLPIVDAPAAIFFYVVTYSIAVLGAFGVLHLLDHTNEITLRDLRGLAKKKPAMAWAMLVFIVSLAGIPPSLGFFGKFYLFAVTVNAGYLTLALLGLLGSAIGIYYYLRIVVHLFMMPTEGVTASVKSSTLQEVVFVATALLVVALGLYPSLVFSLLR